MFRTIPGSSWRLAVFLLVMVACAWNPPRPRTDDELRALRIAGDTYGLNLLPAEPPQLSIHYADPTCTTAGGLPGYLTLKKRCVDGALAPWAPHINIAGRAGMQLSSTPGFCRATWEVFELASGHAPNEVMPGEDEKIEECRKRLRAAGL